MMSQARRPRLYPRPVCAYVSGEEGSKNFEAAYHLVVRRFGDSIRCSCRIGGMRTNPEEDLVRGDCRGTSLERIDVVAEQAEPC